MVGKNYAYQMNGAVNVLLPKGTQLNPFVGTGAGGVSMDDLNGDQFDHAPLGFIGGASIRHIRYGGRPIAQTPTMPGDAALGKRLEGGRAGYLSALYDASVSRVRSCPTATPTCRWIPPTRMPSASRCCA